MRQGTKIRSVRPRRPGDGARAGGVLTRDAE